MKTKNLIYRTAVLAAVMLGLGCLASCDNEPDGKDLYTATGKTVSDYILEDEDLTSFEYILERIGMDKKLSTYGEYTCFAPSNEGVRLYIDSLWTDEEARIPHNGLTENSLEGLTDSLCKDIARYHLIETGAWTVVDMAQSAQILTMLGYPITPGVSSDGVTILNECARIISSDNEAVNGIFHKLDNVIARSTRLVCDELAHMEGHTIFYEALMLTGIDKELTAVDKGIKYDEPKDIYDVSTDGTKTNPLYWPDECKVGYTIFTESDDVLAKYGIETLDDLIEKTHEWYAGAADWYDYVAEKNIEISTGDDYTNPWNTLNMFVRYHILNAKMSKSQFVFGSAFGNNAYGNYNYKYCGGEPYDYFETLLPHTLIKIWQPIASESCTSTNGSSTTLYINRYRPNNTLTDEVGTLGSKEMHGGDAGIRQKIRIDASNATSNRMAYNGYIHNITDVLLYDWSVKNEVLHERMRFESTTFLPEMINNGFRYNTIPEVEKLNGGGSGARIAFPLDYFENIRCYNDKNKLRYNVTGAYNAWQANTMQGWGNYDVAIKLPPVPTGTYEIRLYYSPMDHGGFMQFYLGTSSDISSMVPLGIPLDVRIAATDPRIGWTVPDVPEGQEGGEEDRGIESDRALRNRGYMRAPFSFRHHVSDSRTDESTTGDGNLRTAPPGSNLALRKILGQMQFKQSEEYWFRFKNMLSNGDALKWQYDFIEFVPVDIVNNPNYQEDWM